MALSKEEKRLKIKRRVRKNVSGTAQKPRLSVFRSNKEIYAQLIDDVNNVTLASASSREATVKKEGTKVEVSKQVGILIAEKAKGANVETCVFDRNGYIYHGRVQSLAEGAREGGLKF